MYPASTDNYFKKLYLLKICKLFFKKLGQYGFELNCFPALVLQLPSQLFQLLVTPKTIFFGSVDAGYMRGVDTTRMAQLRCAYRYWLRRQRVAEAEWK